jgi:cytochrome c oxidase cbb3-type subunit I/II
VESATVPVRPNVDLATTIEGRRARRVPSCRASRAGRHRAARRGDDGPQPTSIGREPARYEPPAPQAVAPVPSTLLDSFTYDDDIVRKFLIATFVWGLVGMLVGLVVALWLAVPSLDFDPWLTFGRLRPLHTNAVIFAFAGNAFFTGAYYSTQRLLKTRMFSDGMSRFHFWGWQAIIVSAALTLSLGFTQAKEYAELEWPIDIAIAVV